MKTQPQFHPGDTVRFCEYWSGTELAPTTKRIVGRVLRSWSHAHGTSHLIVRGAASFQRHDTELTR